MAKVLSLKVTNFRLKMPFTKSTAKPILPSKQVEHSFCAIVDKMSARVSPEVKERRFTTDKLKIFAGTACRVRSMPVDRVNSSHTEIEAHTEGPDSSYGPYG